MSTIHTPVRTWATLGSWAWRWRPSLTEQHSAKAGGKRHTVQGWHCMLRMCVAPIYPQGKRAGGEPRLHSHRLGAVTATRTGRPAFTCHSSLSLGTQRWMRLVRTLTAHTTTQRCARVPNGADELRRALWSAATEHPISGLRPGAHGVSTSEHMSWVLGERAHVRAERRTLRCRPRRVEGACANQRA